MPVRHLLSALLVPAILFSPGRAEVPTAETPQQLSRIAGEKGAAPRSDDAFTFVILSDRTGGAARGQWAAAVRQVNMLQPDFVMCVGDLINGYTEDVAEITRQWEEIEAMTKKLDAPFFYCPGNHDISNGTMRKIYVERHGVNGKSYYSFNYRGCHFVVLDSMHWSEEQLGWMAKDLDAAKDARHVFVFYHNPLSGDPRSSGIWEQLRKHLPAGKATVFNGHTHRLGYSETEDGILTYVLSKTAAPGSGPNLHGGYAMFAQVAVSRGKPTVALVPMDQLRPGGFAKFVTDVKALSAGIRSVVIPARGGKYVYSQPNPLPVPITANATWDTKAWEVSPPRAKLTVAPGEIGTATFTLTPRRTPAPLPKVSIRYAFTNPYSGRKATVTQQALLGAYAATDIPRVTGMKVDGELDDFANVKPLHFGDPTRVFGQDGAWTGPEDNSFDVRIATDGERLFVVMDVTDDMIHVEKKPWRDDSLAFFWDAGSPGAPGEGRPSWVQLVVPAEGADVRPVWPKQIWPQGEREAPKGLRAVCKRRAGGYVYEWSIPLVELGVRTPLAGGQTVLLDFVCSDRDITKGRRSGSNISTSGRSDSQRSTAGYVRCKFK